MNTYKKYCPNVYVAKCLEKKEKGKIIIVTTKYGKEIEHYVHNLMGKTSDGCFLYSITRTDGFDSRERAKRKAERLESYAANARKRSEDAYQASKEGRDFLSLGEPIKIGHHSEKRHRALIERNWNRLGKSVKEGKKADEYIGRAEYWKGKENEINLSMPESLDYYEFKAEEARLRHLGIKEGVIPRAHSFSLTYAKKEYNELLKKSHLAIRLWGTEEQVNFLREELRQKLTSKK